jgi:ACS family sodium-dependent inorganic phosphate cotransporter
MADSCLSKRWEVMWFLFSGATIAYTLRVNMSICAQQMMDDLGWTESQKGLVLSAFFWGMLHTIHL